MFRKLRSNYMVHTFLNLKGNPKACVWTEPLWGISYNLYVPYATLFMTAVGLTYADLGYITSITMAAQMIFAVLSGVLCDKMGRRRCTLVFDVLSWSVPELLWMLSQNFTWFAVAALFNGMWRVTENSWYLLLVEDAEKDQIVPLLSLTELMGLIAAFFAPLSKFAIDAFGLVPTMRFFHGLACVMMTAKFVILYIYGTETRNGVRRMEATKHRSMFSMLWECKDVYLSIMRDKRMMLTLGIMALYTLISTVSRNYWALFLNDNLGIAEGDIVFFTTIKSIVTLISIFVLVPRAQKVPFKNPMLLSLAVYTASQILFLFNPGGWLLVPGLVASVVLEAMALSVLSPLVNSLVFVNAEEDERARVCGMVFATVALIVTIFPALIGVLAQINLVLPFIVNFGLLGLSAVLTLLISKIPE